LFSKTADIASTSIYEHLENFIRYNVPLDTYDHRVWRAVLTISPSAMDSVFLYHMSRPIGHADRLLESGIPALNHPQRSSIEPKEVGISISVLIASASASQIPCPSPPAGPGTSPGLFP
jgi:hypothetical protein